MSKQPTDPEVFFESAEAVALAVDSDVLFGLLTRTYGLRSDRVALVTRVAGEEIVCGPGGEIAADDVEGVLLVRTSSFSMPFDDVRVSSLDGYRCTSSVRFRVSLIPERSELRSFQRNVLCDARAADVEVLREYLRSHVVHALGVVAEGRGVEVLLDAKNAETFSGELMEGLKRGLFAGGMRMDGVVEVRFDSSVYRQERSARMAARRRWAEFDARRRISKAIETAQAAHAERLTELLGKLSAAADRSPDHDLGDFVRTFPETERGELYSALFGADDARGVTRWIVAGSGGALLFFSPESLTAPVRTVRLSGEVGPIRSVHFSGDGEVGARLMVGGSRGVYEVGIADGEVLRTYLADGGASLRGGVNAVAVAGDHVFASHSELGLLCWRCGEDSAARSVAVDRTRGAKSVRCVCFHGGRLYFSIDEGVLSVSADGPDGEPEVYGGSGSLVTGLCPVVDGVYAGNAEGEVLWWSEGCRESPEVVHAGRQRSAETVAVLDFGGLRRLFYTDTSVAVFARVLGDTFTCRYEAAGQTLRRAEVAADMIVATNEVRDRLIFWRPGCPGTPLAVVSVSRLTGHSIQDVALVPSA